MTKCVVHRPGYGSVFAATRSDSNGADKAPIVVRDLGFLHLVSILFSSANTDFVSIIISHTQHIFQLATTAAPQIFRIAAVIF